LSSAAAATVAISLSPVATQWVRSMASRHGHVATIASNLRHPDPCRLREAHPSNAGKRIGLGGQRGGEAGVVEPRVRGEIERREAQEEAEHARERLPPERPREAARCDLGEHECTASEAAQLAVEGGDCGGGSDAEAPLQGARRRRTRCRPRSW
jgi:hypothetical protein